MVKHTSPIELFTFLGLPDRQQNAFCEDRDRKPRQNLKSKDMTAMFNQELPLNSFKHLLKTAQREILEQGY